MTLRSWLFKYGPTLGVVVLLAIVWQLVVQIREIPPILLPSPSRVAVTAWKEREALATGFAMTAAAASFALVASTTIGSLIGILFNQSRLLRNAFYPYVVFLQTVPIVAIAPLLITWCGYGFQTVVLVAVVISLFPIVSNVTAGLMSVDPNTRDLFKHYGATNTQTLMRLRIPNAIPQLILGVRVSTGLAVIGAVIGEFFVGTGPSGQAGLGAYMLVWHTRGRTDALIALVIASTLLGLILLGLVNLVVRCCLSRWTLGSSFENE